MQLLGSASPECWEKVAKRVQRSLSQAPCLIPTDPLWVWYCYPGYRWRNQGFKISQAAEPRLNTHTSVTKLVLSSLHHTASPLKMNIWNKVYSTFWQLMASEARYLCKETTAYVRLTFGHEYSQTCLPHSHMGGGSVTKLCPTLENPWTVAQEAPLATEFSRQEYCSELPFPSKGDLSSPGLLYCRWSPEL